MLAAHRWYILGEQDWHILGAHCRYSLGENTRHILGDQTWYILTRLMTGGPALASHAGDECLGCGRHTPGESYAWRRCS